MKPRAAHARLAEAETQEVFIIFGGGAGQPWLWPLRRGFRHCFAALRDAGGWTVLDPLTNRLAVVRLAADAAYDLPGFYRRAGFTCCGPFTPGPPRARWLPGWEPLSCVSLCRAVLGAGAPAALTPWRLYRRLTKIQVDRKLFFTTIPASV